MGSAYICICFNYNLAKIQIFKCCLDSKIKAHENFIWKYVFFLITENNYLNTFAGLRNSRNLLKLLMNSKELETDLFSTLLYFAENATTCPMLQKYFVKRAIFQHLLYYLIVILAGSTT